MIYLFCYDISNPKRLYRTAKFLEKYGVRVQKSFFELKGTPDIKDLIKKEILNIIDTKKDKFFIYPICDRCINQALEDGTGSLLTVDEYIIL